MGSPPGPAGARRAAVVVSAGLAALAAALAAASFRPPGTAPTTAVVGVRAPTCPTQQVASTSTSTPTPTPTSTGRPGLADVLVPPGPEAATVCRYAGLPTATARGPVRSATVATADLAAVVDELDSPRLRPVPSTAVYSCPVWDGGLDLVEFAYRSGPGVRVTVDVGGCGFASNGVRSVQGDALVTYLARWVGEPVALPD